MTSHILFKKKNKLDGLGIKKRHNLFDYSKEFDGKVYSSPNLTSNRLFDRYYKKSDIMDGNDDEVFSILNDSYTQINICFERLLSKMLNIVNAEAASLSLIKPIPNSNNSNLNRIKNFSVSNSSLANNLYIESNNDSILSKNSYKLELTTFINRSESNKNERFKSENKIYKMYKNVKVKKIEKDLSINLSEIQYFCCEVYIYYDIL